MCKNNNNNKSSSFEVCQKKINFRIPRDFYFTNHYVIVRKKTQLKIDKPIKTLLKKNNKDYLLRFKLLP